jgi:hypothetical protein
MMNQSKLFKRKKSQHYLFAYEAIPILFKTQTKMFKEYIDKDGDKFLRFWWDHVGKNVLVEYERPGVGLTHDDRKLEDGTTITLITLPEPEISEAFFLALVKPPDNRFLFWKGMPRVIALERGQRSDGTLKTILGEWTARGNHVIIGPGPEPALDAFYETILKYFKKK